MTTEEPPRSSLGKAETTADENVHQENVAREIAARHPLDEVIERAAQEQSAYRYARSKIYGFLTDPEPPFEWQAIAFIFAVLATCMLIAMPN